MSFEIVRYTKKNGKTTDKVVELVSPYIEQFEFVNKKTGEKYMSPRILVPCFAIKNSRENKALHAKIEAEKKNSTKAGKKAQAKADSMKPFWM